MPKPQSPNRLKIDYDTARKIALALPDVEDSKSYGAPSLKVRGDLLACIPVNKSAEPGSLAVPIDFDRRAELLAAAPDIYYAPEHYVSHPIVLVRLSRIHLDALRDLLNSAWRFVTSKARTGSAKPRRRTAPRSRK